MVAAVLTAASPFAASQGSDFLRPNVHGFRVSQHQNLTGLVLAPNGSIRFRAFTAGNPYRLIVDMGPVNRKLVKSFEVATSSMLSAFSFADPDPEAETLIARLTTNLRRPARIQKFFTLRPKGKARDWQLVADLEPVSRDEFDRLKRPQRQAVPNTRTLAELQDGRLEPASTHRSTYRWTIVLDPGHGGIDKGASSPGGLQEKRVVLSTARLVKRYLERDRRFRVLLTRNDDRYIRLRDRYEFARRRRASLFISIHADANPQAHMRGLSVHTLSARASDRLAARLAERENRSDAIAGVNLKGASKSVSNILLDLARRETRVDSARISNLIIRSAKRRVRLLRKPQRSAGFVVLKAPDVPSVLVELGFLTNARDEKLLRKMAYRKRLAAILARAIMRYFVGSASRRRSGRQSARSD